MVIVHSPNEYVKHYFLDVGAKFKCPLFCKF